MKTIRGFEEAEKVLSRRILPDSYNVSPRLASSLMSMFGTEDPQEAVGHIIAEVRQKGDAALLEYTRKIDCVELKSIEVAHEAISSACEIVSPEVFSALKLAAARVRLFHEKQMEGILAGAKKMTPGTVMRSLERVGVYVPGGAASYPSSVLMTAIPARVAGVKEVIMATPPGKDGKVPSLTLAAASLAGVDRVFAMGGAQAIAALAYGTQSVPEVDKICGPGNIFVMLAKKLVYGVVDIDGLQGPSEVVIIADEKADAAYCAADMLAQAEHDGMAQSVLITTSEALAQAVEKELEAQVSTLERQSIARQSLEDQGIIAVVNSLDEAIELTNLYAPEHLVMCIEHSKSYVGSIKNAGCIFIGERPTVVMGDYVAGPSHALPTSGTARFSSPLNVTDFVKYMNVVEVDSKMLKELGLAAVLLARAEGLTAHAAAVQRRLK